MAVHASQQIRSLLNEAIARELSGSIRYMCQHVLWSGMQGYSAEEIFKKIAIAEMRHAEAIGTRLSDLGGVPVTQPEPVSIGPGPREMLEEGIRDEEGRISLYHQIIETAGREGDFMTRRLFEEIVAQEKDHHKTVTGLLEKWMR